MKKLSPKQEAFCIEYAVDLNATQAAIRAGYSPKTAYSIGNENLKKPEIVARLADIVKDRCDKADINAQFVLDGIKEIATAEDTRDGDKLRAFELLGKYLKMFVDKQEIDHTTNGKDIPPAFGFVDVEDI